jgi:hypothetical protein
MSTVGSSSSLEVSSSDRGVGFFGFVGSGAETGCCIHSTWHGYWEGDEGIERNKRERGCGGGTRESRTGTGAGTGRDADLERGEGAKVDWQKGEDAHGQIRDLDRSRRHGRRAGGSGCVKAGESVERATCRSPNGT